MTTNKQTFRMVALDLDGTLLHSDHQMSDATVEYLRYLDEKGFIVAFATGRSAPTVFEHVIRLNLPHPLPVVCSNGAQGLLLQPTHDNTHTIENQHDDLNAATTTTSPILPFPIRSHCLFSIAVPELIARQTIALAQSLGHVTQYYVGDAIYANPSTPMHYELTKRYRALTGSRTEHIIPIFKKDDNDGDDGDDALVLQEKDNNNHADYFLTMMLAKGLPTKQVVLFPEEQQDAAMEAFQSMFSKDQATIVRGSLGWFLEVLHPDVTKGSGLQRLCSCFSRSDDDNDDTVKLPRWNDLVLETPHTQNHPITDNPLLGLESVVAFGDADNDLEFLQLAGLGIAMKNGRQVCKDVADEITDYTNDEDGVVRTLQRMEGEGLLEFS
ncbi:Sucrose-6F-phosphate phosphohydrolase [Fragilaria crotonensis]|nr:Sucrose-6F-phosphate phosphohydrolase [Fragilaria crotonensis]